MNAPFSPSRPVQRERDQLVLARDPAEGVNHARVLADAVAARPATVLTVPERRARAEALDAF